MSNRVLKKLQGEKELSSGLGLDGMSESDDASASHPPHNSTRKKIAANRFELLTSCEQAFSDTEAKEDDDREQDPVGPVGPVGDHPPERNKLEKQDSTHSTDSLKRKKKKKKKKLKSQRSIEDSLDHNGEDIEATVREVNRLLGEPEGAVGGTSSDYAANSVVPLEKGILSVDHRNLNPDNEMRKIFGAKVIASEHTKRRGRGRVHTRSTMIFSPRNWPHVGKPGLSMTLVETKGDEHFFNIEHSKPYQNVQFQFLDAVESYNPDNIVSLLNMHPYHVDALIQFSDICKMGDDLQMAAELIERALYCFESCFHPMFNVTQGNCRLDYRRAENRSFFVALFKHLHFVGQRGCHRTTLEFCKVLLGLDPDGDPLCVTLLLDFYAVRSEQYAWFLRLFREWEGQRNLSQLPNFAFSIPLAMFLENESKPTPEADEMLQRSLLMFPGLLLPLLEKCSVQPDSVVSSHQYFSSSTQANQPSALRQLIQLYVCRSHQLWKQPEVMAWLETNVRTVLARVDARDPYVAECAAKREIRYQKTPRNVLRHLILSGIKEACVSLPPELSDTPVFGFDPIPPLEAISTYTRPPRPQNTEDQGMLGMFFRSLLPNFNMDLGPVIANREELAVRAEGLARDASDLRRSVTSLLDAMRDLLSNIHLADVPNDGDVESEEDDQDQQQ